MGFSAPASAGGIGCKTTEERGHPMFEKLFSPIKIGSTEIKNRIALEPMGNAYSNMKGE